ncbi:hypothetical protein [Asanoa ferruginea]|nr:hypothetical protein [Asanoa ferruginea]
MTAAFVTSAVALVVAAATSTPATAAPSTPASPAASALTPDQVRAQLLMLTQAGATDAQIKKSLGLIRVPGDSAPDVAPLSSNTSATVGTPSIYYETARQLHYASTNFRWTNLSTMGDGAYGGGNVGGRDAFAIRFSQDVQNHGVAASFCPGNWTGATPYPTTKPGCIVVSPEDNNSDGASFAYQDRTQGARCSGTDYPSCGIYVGAQGTLVFTFKKTGTGCLQVFSKYGHTWSSTTISGVSLSNSGITMNFSSTSNKWEISSPNSGKLGC